MHPSHYDELEDIALWNVKPVPPDGSARLVIVLHPDPATGEMIVSRLEREDFGAIHYSDPHSVELILGYWRPAALLVDTRLASPDVVNFIKAASINPAFARTLLIALANPASQAATRKARETGFDGMCWAPCQVGRLADMLDRRTPRRPVHVALDEGACPSAQYAGL